MIAETVILAGIAGLFGLLAGSFLNVVIWRLPRMVLARADGCALQGDELSLSFPASHCPHCAAPVRWRHNIPVIGYLSLAGRCADCDRAIAPRYPLIEAAGGLVCAGAVLAHGPTFEALALAVFLLLLIALAVIDLESGLLPDRLVLPGIAAGLLAACPPLGASAAGSLPDALAGAAAGYGALAGLGFAYRRLRGIDGLGGGDATCAAMLGAWLGLAKLFVALVLAFGLGLLAVALLALAGRPVGRRTSLPFGPALALAGAIAFLAGDRLLAGYWRLFGPGAF